MTNWHTGTPCVSGECYDNLVNTKELMTEFTLAELDEIHYLVKTYGLENKRNQEQKDLHQSIVQKVNALTANILDNN